MKDYYSILHVLPSAEIDVIKAAYKALARKYHPDTFTGDKAYAGKRMQEINDAFGVIGDPDKRKKYDAERKAANQEDDYSENGEDVDAKTEEDWVIACKYCPDAITNFEQLHKLSRGLAFSYKSYLLDTKKFNLCSEIKNKMETDFLSLYFGGNKDIQSFARFLIIIGERQAALQVNRVAKIMGESIDVKILRNRIYADFALTEEKLIFYNAKYGSISIENGFRLLKILGIKVTTPFFSINDYEIQYKGKLHQLYASENLTQWILDNLSNHPDLKGI